MPGIVEFLRMSSVFAALPTRELEPLAARAREQTYRAREFVFSEGEPAEWFCIVREGRVKILRQSRAGKEVVLDVRGLEPPQPLVRILEQIARLGAGDVLEAILDRRPLLLYPQLNDRGFVHDTDEPQPGVVRVRIRRRSA